MEKKQGSKRSSTAHPKLFGANALQISEDDVSRVVGGIVEKGISDAQRNNFSASIAPPMPSVIPFPLARHRSHGPHWDPMGRKKGMNYLKDDDAGEYKEDENSMQLGANAPFAYPVQRKERTSLDFSRWKDIVAEEESSKANKVSTSAKKSNKDMPCELPLANNARPSSKKDVLHLSSCRNVHEDISVPTTMKTEEHQAPSPVVPHMKSSIFGSEESLESQIDVANRRRIHIMSSDEIDELLGEINEKLKPSVLLTLKNRGQTKLKMQKCSSSDMAAHRQSDKLQKENNFNTKDSPNSDNDILQKTAVVTSKDTSKMVENSSQNSSNLWNAWSKRVEAVRFLRFSLEGDIIENASGQLSGNDEAYVHNERSVGNVNERDFLRSEGDPSAAGYSVNEAVTLTRSVIPGQRALGLSIILAVLEKALFNMHEMQIACTVARPNRCIDWESVWAYTLGPEPELVLALRLCLDDNHNSVVLACTKVIQCVLSCDRNENFFCTLEKTATYEKHVYTAPVFRSTPEIDGGFLQGGYWKYSAKASNILLFDKDFGNDETEGKHTIQDDIVIAGQDFAAGLVRMGILPRLCYLLEMEPSVAVEECILSILVAIARHSPTCANAVMNCNRLVQTVIHRFTAKGDIKIYPSKIKSVCLLKVLARADRKHCLHFIENGSFHAITWHLYKYTSSIDQWIATGRDNCRLSAALIIEQLRFWKVCILNGYCVSYFSDVFPALCLWLNPPTFEKLNDSDVLHEFTSISSEAYSVLEALARRLPNFFTQDHSKYSMLNPSYPEIWPWSCAVPMIELALRWLLSKNDPFISDCFERQKGINSDSSRNEVSLAPMLVIYSTVMRMLSQVLERVIPKDCVSLLQSGQGVPWLPEFVPKIGLELIKNGYLSLDGANNSKYGEDLAGTSSFVDGLILFWQKYELEISLASVCCLHELVRLTNSIDLLLQLAKFGSKDDSTHDIYNPSKEEKILKDGMIKGSFGEWKTVLTTVTKAIASDCHSLLSIEKFGRGGPAPGVGIGWGASGGGYWSLHVLMAQTDARFLIVLLETFFSLFTMDNPVIEENFTVQCVNSTLALCLTLGPRDADIIEKAFHFLLQVPILRYLDFCAQSFLRDNGKINQLGWEYNEEDYIFISKILASHFRERWLSMKKSKAAMGSKIISNKKICKENAAVLDTIYEESDEPTTIDHGSTSLVVEWAHQRLPLPSHWFLSPISTICLSKKSGLQKTSDEQEFGQESNNLVDVAKSGLFFLLGIETLSTCLPNGIFSPVQRVPLIWKLHSISAILLIGMGVLEDERTRSIYEALQNFYGLLLDGGYCDSSELPPEKREEHFPMGHQNGKNTELLRFQSEIHESYSTFVEHLVEQFSAVSYGDPLYGRQVALYLHRGVETTVRLFAWNAMTNCRVLELLPPLNNCIAKSEVYLQPIEDNEVILEAYVKSWVSGALDKAATRGSISYTIALHHLSSYIFNENADEKLSLRNKLTRSLLRDFSQKKHQQQEMMIELFVYTKQRQEGEKGSGIGIEVSTVEKRVEALKAACERNSVLLSEVEKLKSCVVQRLW